MFLIPVLLVELDRFRGSSFTIVVLLCGTVATRCSIGLMMISELQASFWGFPLVAQDLSGLVRFLHQSLTEFWHDSKYTTYTIRIYAL